MLPRIEQKFDLISSNYILLLNWLKDNGFKLLYPERVVTSLYFDNNKFQSYNDTIEGITPRKKIRIRGYDSKYPFYPQNSLTFEKKISGGHGREKYMEKINYRGPEIPCLRIITK